MASVSIDGDKCQGHGRCALIAPDVFDVSEEGVGQVLVDTVPEESLADVKEAVESCPEAAIHFSD